MTAVGERQAFALQSTPTPRALYSMHSTVSLASREGLAGKAHTRTATRRRSIPLSLLCTSVAVLCFMRHATSIATTARRAEDLDPKACLPYQYSYSYRYAGGIVSVRHI